MLSTALTMSGLPQWSATYFEKICGRFVITLSPRAALPDSCMKSSSKIYYFEAGTSVTTRRVKMKRSHSVGDNSIALSTLISPATYIVVSFPSLFLAVLPGIRSISDICNSQVCPSRNPSIPRLTLRSLDSQRKEPRRPSA